ncbi:MAG: tetratricopeptide repeat protein [Verrucomicrobiia bacterium]
MRRVFFWFALLAALAFGCGRKATGEHEFARGLAEYKDGKYDKAAADFERALSSMQTNALALNFLGVCRLQQGETDAGLRNLQDAVRLDPGYIPARYNLALAQLERGQGPDAVANLRQVVQNGAAPADSYYQLGLAYMRVSAWGQAEEAFKHHLPGNTNPAETLNCLGIVAARKHDFVAAKHWFEQCITAEPGFATAYLNLANLENQQLGLKKEALANYEKYIDLVSKTEPREDVHLAMLQVRQELAATGKQAARAPEPPPAAPPPAPPAPKPVAPPPEVAAPKPAAPPPPATIVTATVVSATTSAPPPPPPPPKKVRTPVAARTLKPGNRSKALVLFRNAADLQHQNKAADAIAEYTKVIAADPSFPKAYYNLAIAYGSIGQTERALDNYELALMADPIYADARFNYALLLQSQGFTDDAIAQFKKILAANPTDASTHLSLGTLYARDRATYPEARDHYQSFLKLAPNSPLARDIHRWLDQNP